MPTIVFKPANCEFRKDALFGEVFTESPIGLNYAFAGDGKLKVCKSETVDEKIWTDLESLTKFPVIIHFNESDDALLKKSKDNWSPVSVDGNIVMASAGPVLKVHGERGKKFSDMKVFVDMALGEASKHIPDFVFTQQGKWLIENILTSKAAIIALHSDGRHQIYNEDAGYEFNGMWIFDSFLAEMQEGRKQVFCQEDWELFRD